MEPEGTLAGCAAPSPPQGEIDLLRLKLEKETSKFAAWKAKARVGVDQMRQQVLDLATALDEARGEKERLAQQLATALQTPTTSENGVEASREDFIRLMQWLGCSLDKLMVHLEDKLDSLHMCTSAKLDLYTAAAAVHAASAMGSSPATGTSRTASPPPELRAESQRTADDNEELETYKRRVAMTLRLQGKNCETLQRQVDELTAAAAVTSDTLRDTERVLASRSETVALLERRLEAAERHIRQLEEQRDSMLQGPNMDEVNAMAERVEAEVAQVRAEYAAREDAIFVQHQDELERLRTTVDEEVMRARADGEERLRQAVQDALARQAAETPAQQTASTSGKDDAAYGELLAEYEALEARARKLASENATLRRDAAYHVVAEASGCPSSSVRHSGDESGNRCTLSSQRHPAGQTPSSRRDPASLEEAKAFLAEQHATLCTLSENLWSTKKKLMDCQRTNAGATLPPGALDPQQAVYLKSVLVRLLCAVHDDSVVVNLLPVFSTLLNFGGDDLRHIYKANPSWIVKR